MPHSLRILHTESSRGWGGQEIRILTEAAGMIQRGHQLHLLCPRESPIYDAAQEYRLPVTAQPLTKKRVPGLLAIRGWLCDNPVDVIITHSSTDSWLTALACKTLSKPPAMIRLRHISSPVANNPPTRWLYSRASDHIVTTGQCIRNQLIQDNGIEDERIISIPTGIDLERFKPGDKAAARGRLGLPESDLIVGIVATLRSWKGHNYLVEAFSRLNRSDVQLVIVGDGPQRRMLEAMVQTHGIDSQTTFAGNQADPVPWFQALDVFALPSYANEGVPQALMQAMACGLPVVGGAVGGLPEIIAEGQSGLLVPPRDASALAAALKRLLSDRRLRERLGSGACVEAQRRFGLDTMLDGMESVLARVLNRAG